MTIWIVPLVLAALAQDGPVPPERVDPVSIPVPQSNDPVPASDGRVTPRQRGSDPQTRPTSRIDWSQPAVRPLNPRQHTPASIFTDEAYRRARVRALLEAALEGRA